MAEITIQMVERACSAYADGAFPDQYSDRDADQHRYWMRKALETVVVDDRSVDFTPEEQAINDHIMAAMNGIQDLGLRTDTSNLQVELAAAVHSLQMFIIKHMLERIGPAGWSHWFDA